MVLRFLRLDGVLLTNRDNPFVGDRLEDSIKCDQTQPRAWKLTPKDEPILWSDHKKKCDAFGLLDKQNSEDPWGSSRWRTLGKKTRWHSLDQINFRWYRKIEQIQGVHKKFCNWTTFKWVFPLISREKNVLYGSQNTWGICEQLYKLMGSYSPNGTQAV